MKTVCKSTCCFWLIFRRELRRMVEKPIYLFAIIGAPLICLLFFLTLMHEGLPTDLPIAVVDQDNTPTSRQLIRTLDAFEETKVDMLTQSFSEARMEMQRGAIY